MADDSTHLEFARGFSQSPEQGTTELSSAEDMHPLTASPPASPSDPQPEEYPIELEEFEASPAIPKPFIKTNMVAHEVRLKATGAYPSKSASEPELFTEETTSVLVFEVGGVIRLSAGVVPGQLLVLTNVDSKCEVVAQVKRKRAYRPTSCYVELAFAEPAPRFWGMEFSAATALLPKNAQDVEAAALVVSAEATTDEPGEPPPAPSAEEVQALKRQVRTLQDLLNTAQSSAATEQVPAPLPATVPDAFLAPALEQVTSTDSSSNNSWREAPGAAITANSLSFEYDPVPVRCPTSEQMPPPRPSVDYTISLPKPRRSLRARGNFTPAFRGGVLRLALLTTTLVVTAAGAAWYKHWMPWKSAGRKPSVSLPANAKTATLPGNQHPAETRSEYSNTKVMSDAPVTSPARPSRNTALPNTPPSEAVAAAESATQPSVSNESVARLVVNKTPPATTLAGKHSTAPPTARAASNSLAAFAADGGFVPPKLIKSVRAVASMEALQDFETGNVVIDAVVGTSGEVHFVGVISGPPSLRSPAVESLKEYQYQPATRNGQPVPAHVTITIHFRFES